MYSTDFNRSLVVKRQRQDYVSHRAINRKSVCYQIDNIESIETLKQFSCKIPNAAKSKTQKPSWEQEMLKKADDGLFDDEIAKAIAKRPRLNGKHEIDNKLLSLSLLNTHPVSPTISNADAYNEPFVLKFLHTENRLY